MIIYIIFCEVLIVFMVLFIICIGTERLNFHFLLQFYIVL